MASKKKTNTAEFKSTPNPDPSPFGGKWVAEADLGAVQERSVRTPDEEFERLYGSLTTQLPEIQRAMLMELVRIRCAVEAHF